MPAHDRRSIDLWEQIQKALQYASRSPPDYVGPIVPEQDIVDLSLVLAPLDTQVAWNAQEGEWHLYHCSDLTLI
jgi:hypothetical protein